MVVDVRIVNGPGFEAPEPWFHLYAIKPNPLSYIIGYLVLLHLVSYPDLSFFKDSFIFELNCFWKYALLSLAYFIAVPCHFSFESFYFELFYFHLKWSAKVLLFFSILYLLFVLIISVISFFCLEDWIPCTIAFSKLIFPFALYFTWCFEINARWLVEENFPAEYDLWSSSGRLNWGNSYLVTVIFPPLLLYCVFWLYEKIYLHYNLIHNFSNDNAVEYRWQFLYLIIYSLLLGILTFQRILYIKAATEYINE